MNEGIPTGWRIEREIFFGSCPADIEEVYAAYRWRTWTTKKFLRKAVTRTGWRYAGYSSRDKAQTFAWIVDTDEMMHNERKV